MAKFVKNKILGSFLLSRDKATFQFWIDLKIFYQLNYPENKIISLIALRENIYFEYA